ncbi:MAG: tRNA pseudouridine(55) synthase TruB [Deltaproteobacteria bacterium]|nr:tRNA pseudouridine(55) synthase TruB [Deltaproteobacteria bacterium]
MDAFLVLDKPRGLSSQQAVSRARRALGAAKAGHTGTLDPLATGVLPIALGEATKVIPYLDEDLKEYRVAARLGVATDTYDAEGRETQRSEEVRVGREALEAALAGFLGEQEQVPPPYSAIKRDGKPLYAYAREGREVELKPRRIRIDRLQLESFEAPMFCLTVACGKGTYVRSLIHDLGRRLGTWAHVTELRRLRSGPFTEAEALSLEDLERAPEAARGRLLEIEDCLGQLPRLSLADEEEKNRVLSGVPLRRIKQLIESKKLFHKPLALDFAGRIVAIVQDEGGPDFSYGRVLRREAGGGARR